LLSTALEIKSLPPEVGNKVLARSVFVLIIFLGNVFILVKSGFDTAGSLAEGIWWCRG